MTSQPRFERNVPALLEDLYLGSAPSYRDDLLAAVGRTRQRPAWSFPERWLPVDITNRLALAPRLPYRQLAILAMLAILAAAAVLAYIGTQHHVPLPFGPAANGLLPVNRSGDLFLADPTTGEMRLVLGGPEDDHAPGFSPDGTKIAFLRGDAEELWAMNADGSDVHRVGDISVPDLNWAEWTPDSKHLVVIARFDGTTKLRIFDTVADGTYRDLAPDYLPYPAEVAFRPPNGDEIFFRAQLRNNPGFFGLFSMKQDGSDLRTIIEPNTAVSIDFDLKFLAFTADGSRIFYMHKSNLSVPESPMELWVMNADGSDRHRFVHVDGAGWEGEQTVSPDGQYLAFYYVTTGPGGQIAVVRTDGTGPVVKVGDPLPGTASFVWSPDSTKLLVLRHEDTPLVRPWLLDPAGGPGTRIPIDIEGEEPDWQRLAP